MMDKTTDNLAPTETSVNLKRSIGLGTAVSLIVGGIIGELNRYNVLTYFECTGN